MKSKVLCVHCFLSVFAVWSSTLLYGQEVIALWPNDEIPFSKPCDLVEKEKEAWGTRCVFDITKPTLTFYPAKGDEISNKAVVVIPGGGYGLVAMYHEGHDVAERLAEAGISSAVLKYRLPNPKSSDTPENVPLADARRAIELTRHKMTLLDIDSVQVGVLGFSAGSHLASVASLWPVDESAQKPDFSVLIYGVTVPSQANYDWLEESLYYRKMTDEEKKKHDLLSQVSQSTPPAFLVHAYDDDICPVEESTKYAERLVEYAVPVEMHLFQSGGHGFGLGREVDGTHQWLDLCVQWLYKL